MYCRYCGAQISNETVYCPTCGGEQRPMSSAVKGFTTDYAPMPIFSMRWFRFLILFGLFFWSFVNVVGGVFMVTGFHYELFGGSAEAIYYEYGRLQILDISVGIAMLVCAVLAVFARFRLAGFYRDALKVLNVVFLISAIINIVYEIGIFVIVSEDIFNITDSAAFSASVAFAVSMIIISVNATYFTKREELFRR